MSLKPAAAAKVTKKASRQRLLLKTRQRQPSKTFLANQERRKMINFLKGAIGVPEGMFTSMSFGRIEELYNKEMAKLKGDFIQRVEVERKLKERHDLNIQQPFPDSKEGTPIKEKAKVKEEETLAQKIGAITRKKSIATKKQAKRSRTEEKEKENESERAEAESVEHVLKQNQDHTMNAPKIIHWDILKDQGKEYFRIKRLGDHYEVYATWGKIIRSCSRSDLEEMHKVGMSLYGKVLEEAGMSLIKIAMEYLCMMFDPDRIKHIIRDMNHERVFRSIDHWMLIERCGVYVLTIDKSYHEYYLVDKVYDHSRAKLQGMLRAKLVCSTGTFRKRNVKEKLAWRVKGSSDEKNDQKSFVHTPNAKKNNAHQGKSFGKPDLVYSINQLISNEIIKIDHIEHLRQSFDILRQYHMKLKPTKCSFGVSAGKFLGYMVTRRGIEANPDQIKAIIEIKSPRNFKEVQRLTGVVAALNRFISRSSDKCHLFYNILRKNKGFQWTNNHEQALQKLKEYMASPPLLSKPQDNEVLQLYLVVSSNAVSAILVKEEDKHQLPIYYVSKSLLDTETRYSSIEKLLLSLVTAAKKLRHYFESHSITVVTNFPLKSVLQKPELTGRLAKWSIYLISYDIDIKPRIVIKSQVLADFVADFSPELENEAHNEVCSVETHDDKPWILHVYGSSYSRGIGLGVVLKSPQGGKMVYSIRCDFKATNNKAEYEALIVGMNMAHDLGAKGLHVKSDSLLVVNQINGEFAAKDSKMTPYLKVAKAKSAKFEPFSIEQIPRDLNTQEDALANLGSALSKPLFDTIPMVHLTTSSIDHDDIGQIDDEEEDWSSDIMNYLTREQLPEDRAEARKIRFKASRYVMIQGRLYRRSSTRLNLRCVTSKTQAITGRSYDKTLLGMCRIAMHVNDTQFCEDYNIKLTTSTQRYPQSNGLVESSNKTIVNSIKKRLKAAKGRWVEELPSVLWENRMTPHTSTGQTPFSLVYGCEAVLPVEVQLPTLRHTSVDHNLVDLSYDLDALEELRESALIRLASQKQTVERHFNKNVKTKVLQEGDHVLRRMFQNTQEANAGKLSIKWEGPYRISKVMGKGAYRLQTLDDQEIPRSWNATHLKRIARQKEYKSLTRLDLIELDSKFLTSKSFINGKMP
ncbi:hypothetical protein L6452_26214 [Arctium lappa]|uniref:Uncharacterized protein n=1 Tax=Arctium lappa TaxID=4217 RepID=A0ACB9AD08_ARCLA|nr:hypothetical protein L6452_26214 [Arctium lappa]